MGAVTAEEVASLQREFDWVLTTEVDNVTRELKAAVKVNRNHFQSFPQTRVICCFFTGVCKQVSDTSWGPQFGKVRLSKL